MRATGRVRWASAAARRSETQPGLFVPDGGEEKRGKRMRNTLFNGDNLDVLRNDIGQVSYAVRFKGSLPRIDPAVTFRAPARASPYPEPTFLKDALRSSGKGGAGAKGARKA